MISIPLKASLLWRHDVCINCVKRHELATIGARSVTNCRQRRFYLLYNTSGSNFKLAQNDEGHNLIVIDPNECILHKRFSCDPGISLHSKSYLNKYLKYLFYLEQSMFNIIIVCNTFVKTSRIYIR